jgi:hypothetical protein
MKDTHEGARRVGGAAEMCTDVGARPRSRGAETAMAEGIPPKGRS